MIEIPREMFNTIGTGEIKQLPDSLIDGHTVHRLIRRIVLPNVGEKLGWMRYVESAEEGFLFATVEVHVTEDNASADPAQKHPKIVGAVFYVPKSYYSKECLLEIYDIHAGKKGTDGEDVAITSLVFQQTAQHLLMQIPEG
ncbi:MAG: hypothetical protein NTU76_00470 [Candidatus Taylorbacteria bacterium]|nr:hypothetical protein [Candidatus Taylorbacteria bacterium]